MRAFLAEYGLYVGFVVLVIILIVGIILLHDVPAHRFATPI